MKRILRHPLVWICLLGLGLRVWFAVASNHVYFPDEIFQSLEQAHRIVYGYGVIPWDVAYGLRSFVYPLLLAIPLEGLKLVGVTRPENYTVIMRILLGAFSMILVPTAYLVIMKMTRKKYYALLAAFVIAVWYELIYFSSRAFTEVFSVYVFAAAINCLWRFRCSFLTGLLSTAAFFFRIQYFPLYLLILWVSRKEKLSLPFFLTGAACALVIFGVVDLYFYGSFFYSILANVRLSWLSGISEMFGTQPWYYYVVSLGISSAWSLVFVGYNLWKTKFKHPLAITFISIVVIHSLLHHKEYRFVFAAIPMWLLLLVNAISQWKRQAWLKQRMIIFYSAAIMISIAGMMHLLLDQSRVYGQPFLLRDPDLEYYTKLSHDSNMCGIFDHDRTWIYTGGYYYLHQPVPIYSGDSNNITVDSISYLITTSPNLQLAGFENMGTSDTYDVYYQGIKKSIAAYTLYKRTLPDCKKVVPAYIKSFSYVQDRLGQIGAVPKLQKGLYE